MQHSVQKQGKYRYNSWRSRQLVTHDKEPYLYMERKTHPDSKKMLVETVELWPHYDKFLVPEAMNTSAAARTVILRGRLFPLTFEDLDFLAEVRNGARNQKKKHPHSTVAKASSRASPTEGDAVRAASIPGSKHRTPAAGKSLESVHPSDGAAGPNSFTSEDEDADTSVSDSDDDDVTDTVSDYSLQPKPAGLSFTNPLIAMPTLRNSRRRGSRASHRGGGGAAREVDTRQNWNGNDSDEDEDDAPQVNQYGERLDAHGTVGVGKPTVNPRLWVVRCPNMDALRLLVHTLQGVDDYSENHGTDGESRPPVPPDCFKGTFEEVEAELRRVKR